MGQPVYTPDGQLVEVDEGEAAQGFREGRYRLARGPVRVRLADGSLGTVDDTEAQAVLDAGGAFASADEMQAAAARANYESTGQQAQTAAEGVGRGLTFGGSDVAMRALGGEGTAAEMRQRREFNPGTALAGEVVGAVAPMLVPGAGAASAARLAGEGTALARAGAAAAGVARGIGAPVRAVVRLGDAGATGGRLAAEALGLEGRSLASRVAARGLEEAGRGVAEGAFQGLGGAISEIALGETPDIRADRILAHVGMGALLGGAASGALGSGGRLAREGVESLTGAMNVGGLARQAAQARLEASGVWGKRALSEVEARSGGLERAAAELDRLGIGTAQGRGVAGRLNLPTAGNSLDDAARVLGDARTQFANIDRGMAEAVERAEAAGLRDAANLGPRAVGRVDVAPLLARVDDMAAKLRLAVDGGEEAAEDLLRRVKGLRGKAETGIEFAEAHAQRRRWDSEVRNWAKGTSELLPQEEIKTLRNLMGAQLGESAERAGLGNAWEMANRDFAAGRMVEKAAGSLRLSEIGGIGGAVATGVDLAAGGGALAAMDSDSPLAIPLAAVGLFGRRFAAQEVRRFAPAVKARALAWLARATASSERSVSRAASGIVRQAGRGARAALPVATVQAYQTAVRDLREMTPEVLTRRVGTSSAALLDAAPETHAAVVQRALTAQSFLTSRIPTSDRMRPGDLQPHLRGNAISESDRRRFMALKQAVDDPGIVLDAISDHTVTPDQVAVLREVYPALYQETRTAVMRAVAEAKEPLSYDSRLRLGIVLGVPTDPSLMPAAVTALQDQYAEPEGAPDMPAPGPVDTTNTRRFASENDAFMARRAGG